MFIQGYSDFCLKTPILLTGLPAWTAHFKLDSDVSELFPYINTVVKDAIYYDKPHYIRFTLNGFGCSLYTDRVAAGSFEDREQALDFVIQLIDFLNDLFSKKDSLRPDHKKYRHQPVLEIFKLLPRTNCQECGFPTCMAFAAALSNRQVAPEQCPWFPEPIRETAAYPVYDENGRVISTTEIELNISDSEQSLKTQQEGARVLENGIPTPRQEEGETGFEGDHHGIRVILTGREVEVLRLMAEGFTNPEISEILSISHHTVKSHVVHIFNKLGVNDRTQAAVWAARNRLV